MAWLGFTKVSSHYGIRKDPFGSGKDEFHAGIDLVKAHKGVINSFTDGIVIYAGEGKVGTGLGNYGNVVFIQDKEGYGHVYAHLDSISVKIGEKIKEGQGIGRQGSTGKSTASHLHYEVRKTISPSYGWTSDAATSTVDPGKYLDGLAKVSDGWEQVEGKWHFYKDSKKVTGWLLAKEKWYYLDANGVMETGWVKVKEKWYYLDASNGDMKTGWVQVAGKWYLLDTNGEMLTEWQKVKGKWYYLYPNGAMAESTWLKVGKDGAMQ